MESLERSATSAPGFQSTGLVVIGRNEGDRLVRCLSSIPSGTGPVVYVDSGSTDGSPARARALGAIVVELDMSRPFSAARGRNAGYRRLIEIAPGTAFVQFVDGDCALAAGWLAAARVFLDANPDAAVVFGRRLETNPETSVYNRLCDAEWAVKPGEVRSCGGDAMVRVDAFSAVGGFRDDLIAGEEPEMCVRLRQSGWRIFCIDHPMTHHDAAITRFAQWWHRAVRCGYAFAQGAYLHGNPPERHCVREARRAWIWGAGVPAAITAATLAAGPAALSLALIYPFQIARLYVRRRHEMRDPLLVSAFHVLGRFPEVVGQLRFERDRILRRQARLIEYK
jgi:GT2 family glycosyltransferase